MGSVGSAAVFFAVSGLRPRDNKLWINYECLSYPEVRSRNYWEAVQVLGG
jgi:hypothetical protein